MAFIPWSDKYSAHVAEIDDEHQELFSAINQLHQAMEAGESHKVITPLLQKVEQTTRDHFADEETLMKSCKFPGTTLHLMKHEHLLNQLQAFVVRFSREGSNLNAHSLQFLSDWLITHVSHEDASFAQWLKEHDKP